MIFPFQPELAYIGPGAGFAFLGSFVSILGGMLLGVASVLLWPVRVLWGAITGRQGYKNAKVKRLVFLGLDGLDPTLAERYMQEGKLPNLSRLREQGSFHRLRTTFPALSPVAWSTFATGVNPARHAMFDFLNRSLSSYMPYLSSSRVSEPARILKLGKYRIPLGRPIVEMRRKSKTFWQILGQRQIVSTILRVPITFPPEKFNGRVLSAMCTPDLLGTQGTFALYTTRTHGCAMEGGNRFPLVRDGAVYRGAIQGPSNTMRDAALPMEIRFTVRVERDGGGELEIEGERHRLTLGEYTPWIRLTFSAGLGIKVSGIARFLLTESGGEVSVYSTPINIDPEAPALPISHPSFYAAYLSKLLGAFSTLGMAEDTWALNEHAIDADAFLKQAYLIFEERKEMFFSALDRTRRGVVACVFDTTDRVQHMFFAQKDGEGEHSRVIEDLYRRADELVGRTMALMDSDSALFVLSDHGFTSFERGVDLNAWLVEHGYLALKESASGANSYLKDVDWSRTRAYTFGLAGVYINQKGREAEGIVDAAEARVLKRELATKLSGLYDEQRGRPAVRHAWPSDSLYTGPYLDAAPDVIVGYAEGYRASWDSAVGKVTAQVFADNAKAWSGDHCVDPHLVPGVLFSNRKIEAVDPGIEDMAPTALDLFGIEPPPYMEGKSVFGTHRRPLQQEAAA
jgi:predicted AlkP superfamily phosphohydrolase/phosphomutase